MSRSHATAVVLRRVRYLAGRAEGLRYRLRGRHPDPDVPDDVVADRVRATLGTVTRQLDLPHVHVAVRRRIAILHGEVGSDADADRIEAAAQRVPGVDGVLSYLHVGLTAGDTRPSEGAFAYVPSTALKRLWDAAAEPGDLPDSVARSAVRAVLATFLGRLPEGEREHVLAHLPRDVQVVAAPPRYLHPRPARLRHVPELLDAVVALDHLDPDNAGAVTASVLAVLRELVPEEVADVAAVLPPELREMWLGRPAGE